MENASKALIIAGAILLSILIIGLGMMIFNQARDAMDTSAIDQLSVQQYNADFESYRGSAVRGSTVKTLWDKVQSHNRTHQDDESLQITLDGVDSKAAIKSGSSYKVEVTEYTSAGYVSVITITENTNGN